MDSIHEFTKIDKWILYRLKGIIDTSEALAKYDTVEKVPDELLLKAKKQGFSDFQVARAIMGMSEDDMEAASMAIRKNRLSRGIRP